MKIRLIINIPFGKEFNWLHHLVYENFVIKNFTLPNTTD